MSIYKSNRKQSKIVISGHQSVKKFSMETIYFLVKNHLKIYLQQAVRLHFQQQCFH